MDISQEVVFWKKSLPIIQSYHWMFLWMTKHQRETQELKLICSSFRQKIRQFHHFSPIRRLYRHSQLLFCLRYHQMMLWLWFLGLLLDFYPLSWCKKKGLIVMRLSRKRFCFSYYGSFGATMIILCNKKNDLRFVCEYVLSLHDNLTNSWYIASADVSEK